MTEQTIEIYRGEKVTLDVTMSPVENITGWTLVFTVAKQANSTTKKMTATGVVTNGPAGTFRVELEEEATDIAPDEYFWDVWRNDEGLEQVKAGGPFVVLGNARLPPAV